MKKSHLALLLSALFLAPGTNSFGLADVPKSQVAPAPGAPQKTMTTQFPLRASENGRFLVDAKNQPFFYQADTPWMMLLQLSLPEAEELMADRKAKGFTTLQIMMTGFMGKKNRDGHSPFEGDFDFSRPNEAYFAHADKVIQKAADMGLFLMIAPLWSGCCGEGWAGQEKNGSLKPLNRNGSEKAYNWGAWLGARTKKHDHIAWLLGGDKNPGESHELIRQLARGLHASAPHHLKAVHNAPENSSARFYDDQPWLSLNAAYTYREVFAHVHGEWNRAKARPIFLSESGYERESNDGRGGDAFRIRRQAYGAILSGALAGHAYGHREIWRVSEKWRESLGDAGAGQMKFVSQLFTARAWWKLVPEGGEELIPANRGKVGEVDFLSAARTSDGTLAVVYIPTARAFSIDLARLSAPVKAKWFDPTNGELKEAATGALPNQGHREFTPPQKNAAGQSDWVLLLESL